MRQVQPGDTVKVHYTGKLDDGTIFDSTIDREPFEIKIGSGLSAPGFEMRMTGMAVGDKRSFSVPPDEGFGLRDAKFIEKLDRANFPEDLKLEVGKQLQVPHADGGELRATVTELDDTTVTLDANHPLAGKILHFDVEIIEIL
ncbi:MAG: peptidylprolyl isomerase [bacterium]|nr:peptidylprolyl isomerase [bacterium]